MKRLTYFSVMGAALIVGFVTGRLTHPVSVKAASGFTYVVRIAAPGAENPATVPTLYGSPISISCSGDNCYVLTSQEIKPLP
jgi:hypothetical protein